MALPPIKSRTRATADLINRIIEQANRGGVVSGGKGMLVSQGLGGTLLARDPIAALLEEPADEVVVVNLGATTIPAFSPAGIIGSVGDGSGADGGLNQAIGDLLNQRALRVRTPKAEDASNFVIVQDAIDPGGAGLAWCSGICPVRLMRWFQPEAIQRADILAGEQYVLANADGALDLVWTQRQYDQPIVNAEHWALARFNGRRFLRWFNSGATTVPNGAPLVPPSTDTDGLVDVSSGTISYGILNLRTATGADAVAMAYVNVGGDVAPGAIGRCTINEAVVRTAGTYNAGATVGAVTSGQAFSSSGTGWQVMARMGARSGVQYALVKPAGGSSVLMTLSIVGGNTLSDGSTLGIKWVSSPITSVPSAYDPNVTSSFIDGIGRADLDVNGVSGGRVLVARYSGNGGPTTVALFAGDRVLTSPTTIAIPVSGDPVATVTCYVDYSP